MGPGSLPWVARGTLPEHPQSLPIVPTVGSYKEHLCPNYNVSEPPSHTPALCPKSSLAHSHDWCSTTVAKFSLWLQNEHRQPHKGGTRWSVPCEDVCAGLELPPTNACGGCPGCRWLLRATGLSPPPHVCSLPASHAAAGSHPNSSADGTSIKARLWAQRNVLQQQNGFKHKKKKCGLFAQWDECHRTVKVHNDMREFHKYKVE